MKTSYRTTVLAAAALAAGTALVGPASPAGAAADPTATIGEVTCVENDGSLVVDLQAADASQSTFLILLDGSSFGEDHVLEAGAGEQVPVTGLEDGDHTVEVLAATGEQDLTTVASSEPTVACDAAPVGPYTNAKGSVVDVCDGGAGEVLASNKPIGGNVEDLQPVDFDVVFTPDPVVDPGTDGGPDGGTDGGTDVTPDPVPDPAPRLAEAGVEQVLDSFTLDASQQTYDRTFGPDELGGTGELTLRTGETVVASEHIYLCLVLPAEGGTDESGGPNGPDVPDTGF